MYGAVKAKNLVIVIAYCVNTIYCILALSTIRGICLQHQNWIDFWQIYIYNILCNLEMNQTRKKGVEMKRIIAGMVVISMLLLVGCGGNQESESSSIPPVSSSSSQVSSSIPSSSSEESNTPPVVVGDGNGENATTSDSVASSQQTPQVVSVTIPEGSTFMDIARALENNGVCSQAAFYQAAQNYTVQSFNVPSSPDRCFKMEGYLFPDTYQFYVGEDPTSVLRKMLNNYAAKSGMPSDQTLILASIIEKEARSTENMQLVSSVYHNRINAGMRLDADPTREYVNDYITGNSLLGDTSKYAALYNTYKCSIPAGPICNPSKRAIEAAQNPPATNYYYFFFGNDNQNHYSATLEEHNQQIAQYGVQYQ